MIQVIYVTPVGRSNNRTFQHHLTSLRTYPIELRAHFIKLQLHLIRLIRPRRLQEHFSQRSIISTLVRHQVKKHNKRVNKLRIRVALESGLVQKGDRQLGVIRERRQDGESIRPVFLIERRPPALNTDGAYPNTSSMDQLPETNEAKGEPLSTMNAVLTTGAAAVQDFRPVKHICAHLNAFHAYAHDTNRVVEANHYCSHLNEDVRQCILYDSPEPNARLIGIEYMISARLYSELPPEERKLWHSHVYEVKSGMLIMPKPAGIPDSIWEAAENAEMEQVVTIYGKIYHLWQVDRGDKLPLGEPQLMTSFTAEGQFDFEKHVGERDARFGSDAARKREKRAYIEEPEVHPDADQAWKEKDFGGP